MQEIPGEEYVAALIQQRNDEATKGAMAMARSVFFQKRVGELEQTLKENNGAIALAASVKLSEENASLRARIAELEAAKGG